MPVLLSAGDLALLALPQLEAVLAPELTAVGRMDLWELPALVDLGLCALDAIEDLDVRGARALFDLELAATVTDDLSLDGTAAITLGLPQLTMGRVVVRDQPNLLAFGAPSLTHAEGLLLSDLPRLAVLELGVLEQVTGSTPDGSMQLVNNPWLVELKLKRLTHLTGELVIDSHARLVSFEAPALASLQQLVVRDNDQLPTCEVTALAQRVGVPSVIWGNAPCP